jgi:chemotaxis protein methyltransferase CheR
MTRTSTRKRQQEYLFTEQDLERLRHLIHRHTGIHMPDNRRDLIYGRLSRRLRALGLSSFADYCRFLEEGDQEELEAFRNAVTTNLTAFFREEHHFDYLADTLLPRLVQEKRSDRRLRFWSAGCSTGEEPYSLAIVLHEQLPDLSGWDTRILATDLDSSVLARAEAGIYEIDSIRRGLGPRLERWFLRGRGPFEGQARIRPELQELVSFRMMNLMESWPMKGPFDAIFCRNVLIYFDKPTQKKLFERFAGMLPLEGHLFIGHSESPLDLTDRFELIGKSIYRRTR